MISITVNGNTIDNYLTRCTGIPIISRGRDWTPAFLGFTMSLSVSIGFSLAKNQEVIVSIDSTEYYLGFVNKFKFDNDNQTWSVEVNHYLMKFEDYYIAEDVINFNEDVADFSSPITFTIGTNTIQKASHGLSDGDRIQVRSVGGTLPTGLEANKNYYIKDIDGDSFYLFKNFGDYCTLDLSSDTSRKATFSGGSGTMQYTDVIDFDLYDDWGFFRDIQFFVNGVTDQITTNSAIQNIPANGNYHGYKPKFDLVLFHKTTTLPSPLTENRAYIAAKFEEDTGFVLYDSYSNYDANNRIGLGDSSETFYLSFPLRFGSYSATEDDDNNVPYPTSFISLRWLVVKMFDKIGITLITTSIDSVFWDLTLWSNLLIFEQMFYNINQSTPIRPEELNETNSPYLNSQITFADFIIFLFGKLGINLVYKGSYTYELIAHDDSTVFNIPDNNKLKYESDIVNGSSGGWTASRNNAGTFSYISESVTHAWSHIYNDRPEYLFNDSTLTEYGFQREGRGYNNINWFNNFILFYRAASGSSIVQLSSSLYETLLDNEINSFSEDWEQEEIEARMSYLSQEIWNVKEINLSVQNRRINITQETILP
jgi:hypothetical protein